MDRKYTLSEIDTMREAVQAKNRGSRPYDMNSSVPRSYLGGSTGGGGPGRPSGSFDAAAALERWERSCEDQLRTYLAAGLGPEDFPSEP